MDWRLVRDNYRSGAVGEFLRGAITSGSQLSIVSAYFTIYAYHCLSDELDSIEGMRFLFGDPSFVQSIDPERKDLRNFIIDDESLVIPLEEKIRQKSIARRCAHWLREKAEIRSILKQNFLHGKLYHVRQANGNEEAIAGSSNFTARGLGLSEAKHANNIELNLVVDSTRTRQELKLWFDELWENTELTRNVKPDVLEYLKLAHSESAPEFVYFKTLFHIFENYLSETRDSAIFEEKTGFLESEIWRALYEFQRHGVKAAINKILKHGGCIIADSVGLGKTYEALAVIKYFELRNHRVLVLCPKKLASNWSLYQAHQNNALNPFQNDRFGYTLLYHTDMGRVAGRSGTGIDLSAVHWSNFDLLVIDESHNFRGDPRSRNLEDGSTKLNRAAWLMQKIIQAGSKTKVLMLSATPVNNTLHDLRNQINFITEGKNDALYESCKIPNISLSIQNAQRSFREWAKAPRNAPPPQQQGATTPTTKRTTLLERLDSSFFKLLDELTIARSRRHITQFYNIHSIGKFPRREAPLSLSPPIDSEGKFPSYERINEQIHEYKLSIFTPSQYLRPEFREQYDQADMRAHISFTQQKREHYLIGMMKVNYLKRLESSIHSFAISLDRTIEKIDTLIEKIDDFSALSESQQARLGAEERGEGAAVLGFEAGTSAEKQGEQAQGTEVRGEQAQYRLETMAPSDDELDEEDEQGWQVGKKLKFQLAHLNASEWKQDLQNDRRALATLRDSARSIGTERDAKLHALKELIREKVRSPFNAFPNESANAGGASAEGNKKVLVFTAFADTAEYLYANLCDWAKQELGLESALVTGSRQRASIGGNQFDSILTNFSPRSKNRSLVANAMANPTSSAMGVDQNTEQHTNQNPKATPEIDLLIATDCISEGQNLQDCDYLVNYDIHWNPVRIIQRFGRIDRIGSTNASIRLVNFWPTADLDNYINLKERVECRMALVDVTATGNDNLLSPSEPAERPQTANGAQQTDRSAPHQQDPNQTQELENLIAQELHFRDLQLKRFQNEILDIEDMDESISLSDFSLDDFRNELDNYIKQNKEKLEKAPTGLYALLPAPGGEHAELLDRAKGKRNINKNIRISPSEKEIIQPGVIFCLRQRQGTENSRLINPLSPYFLLYIRRDGEIRYNFSQAKQVLEICRLLCAQQTTPHAELCALFNKETEYGERMDGYNAILHKAVAGILASFGRRSAHRLTSDRNATISPPADQLKSAGDFDLVTWFILK